MRARFIFGTVSGIKKMELTEMRNKRHISQIASLRWCIRSNIKGEKNCSTQPRDGIMATFAQNDTDAPR